MPIIHQCDQGSKEWHLLRMGKPTASCFDKIVTPGGKSKDIKLSKSADGYMYHLLAELMVGHPILEESTKWMERGHELEGEAVRAAELALDCESELVGFITTDDGRIGCSPDRAIPNDWILEIKCPKEITHMRYMLTQDVEYEYRVQLQGQIWVADKVGVRIVSYHPELPSVILTVPRDEEYIEKLSGAVTGFADVLQQAREFLESKYGKFSDPLAKRAAESEDVGSLGISDEDAELIIAEMQKRGDLNG